MVEVLGIEYSIAEVAQQLAWLGAALHSSSLDQGVSCCTPYVHADIGSYSLPGVSFPLDLIFRVTFRLGTKVETGTVTNGQCWHDLFRNPILVTGYPVPERSREKSGLEIPLDMMAALVQTKQVNTFRGKLFLKGFSTMLVPTDQHANMFFWHIVYNDDGSRISYLNAPTLHLADLSVSDILDARHVVGWCSEAKFNAGK